jgi:serine/threonine protein kinase
VATHTDILIGRIALERGLITSEQLVDVLRMQAEAPAGDVLPIGRLLLDRGFIKAEDLDALLEEQKQRLSESFEITDAKLEDQLLGRLLVKHGLATEKQVYECLRTQAEQVEQGKGGARLSDLLVKKGYLKTDAIANALKIQARLSYICTKCNTRFTALTDEPVRKPLCKKCGAPLAREQAGTSVEALPASSRPLPHDVEAAQRDSANRFAGKYVLVKEVGRGGSGIVWKAWQSDLERYVAIKQMSSGLWGENELKRFFREAQTAANLSHNNIATIYEVGSTADGKHWIAMEFVDGEALSSYYALSGPSGPSSSRHGDTQRRERKHLPLETALQVARDAALAVDYAHSKGVVHRDVKPQNVMIARGGGRVYVMDFGLAKPVKTKDGITMGDTIVGTPPYMSPEQARGDAVDRRTDVYGLGALLYFILTGRAPFVGHSPAEIIMKVLTDDPDPPTKVNPGVPPDLERIALKALEKDKHRRYETARAFADDIQHFLNREPISVRPLSIREKAVRAVRQRPALTGGIIAAVAGVLIVVAWSRVSASTERSRVEAHLSRAAAVLKLSPPDWAAAFAEYERALELDPANRDARAGRDRCRKSLDGGMHLGPELRARADELFAAGDFAAAHALYTWLQARGADPALAARLRDCEERLRDAREAEEARQRTFKDVAEAAEKERVRRELRAESASAYVSARGVLESAERLKQKIGQEGEVTARYREAELILSKCLAKDGSYVEARYLRGQVRLRLGNTGAADQDFLAVQQENPRFGPARFGSAHVALIEYALWANAPYVSLSDRAAACWERVTVLSAQGAGDSSLDTFERWAAKAMSLMTQRRTQDAVDALGVLGNEGRGQRAYYFIMACLRLQEGRIDDAIKELTGLLELDPLAAEALYLRAALRLKASDADGALADSTRLVTLLADHPYAYLVRAVAHELRGKKDLALKDLEKAASLDTELSEPLKPWIEKLK